jgi:putative transposase
MTDEELSQLVAKIGISNEGLELIRKIRESQPARRVRGGSGNVPGTFPSRKMGFTIQSEAHRNELPFILECEHDPDVLEYYDQPCKIPLDYMSARGRRVCVMHTPDFFVLRPSSAGFEECKLEELLPQLAQESPNRYVRDTAGNWRCPPGEAFANRLGLYYRIRSSAEINRIYYRNMIYLDDYFRARRVV